MTYNFKEYDAWRNSLKCDICHDQHYRMGMCKSCYKTHRENSFHCTHKNCISPVFGATLCQRHYRSYRQRCLICSSRYVFYRHLCRTHYRQATKSGNFPIEPICKVNTCLNKTYVENLCLKHFKDKYRSNCSVTNCEKKSHRKGLCCAHYFQKRRKEENEYINNKDA